MRHLDDVTSADTGRRPLDNQGECKSPFPSLKLPAPHASAAPSSVPLHHRRFRISHIRQSRSATTRTFPGRPLTLRPPRRWPGLGMGSVDLNDFAGGVTAHHHMENTDSSRGSGTWNKVSS
jgi:hypothetical protein